MLKVRACEREEYKSKKKGRRGVMNCYVVMSLKERWKKREGDMTKAEKRKVSIVTQLKLKGGSQRQCVHL